MLLREFDANPDLLGLPDGSVCDLRTGKARTAEAEDYVSRSVTAMPDGSCSLWLKFLREITAGDAAMVSYFQRLCGYCLTGHINEEDVPSSTVPAAMAKALSGRPFRKFWAARTRAGMRRSYRPKP